MFQRVVILISTLCLTKAHKTSHHAMIFPDQAKKTQKNKPRNLSLITKFDLCTAEMQIFLCPVFLLKGWN